MQFLTRSLAGLFLIGLTLGLIGFAASNLIRGMQDEDAAGVRGRGAQERVYAVTFSTITLGEATPVISAYGDVASRRTLEIRVAVGGRVTELADAFRDGGQVSAGDLLVRIDPADARAALDVARAELAEAGAGRTEAETRLELAEQDLAAAEQTRDLRASALTRQRDLLARGAGTGAAVENAEIALATARQAVVSRRQALAQAEASVDLARIAVERRAIAVREAERTLEDTVVTAPFDGLLSATTAVPGGILSANEKVGSLIDTTALEASFRVSGAQYARLFASGVPLSEIVITATLPLDEFPITVAGHLDRVGAEVGQGQTGRLLYARLDGAGAEALRPGDFLTVLIEEPPLRDVSVIPASAATTDGEILLLGPDDRLEPATVRILRRQGDDLIVSGAPAGREYARERLPQLGAGVKVRPVRAGAGLQSVEMVRLDGDRRARLKAAVEANTGIPQPVRERMLRRLDGDEVPKDMVDRLESPGDAAATAATGAAATTVLTPERRARLIVYVERDTDMPVEVKARILDQLDAEAVPTDVVTRLEQRMGN